MPRTMSQKAADSTQATLDPYLIWQFESGMFRTAKEKGWYVQVLMELPRDSSTEPQDVLNRVLPTHANSLRGKFRFVSAITDIGRFFDLLKASWHEPNIIRRLQFVGFIDPESIRWPEPVDGKPIKAADLLVSTHARMHEALKQELGRDARQGSHTSVAPLLVVIDDRCSLGSAALPATTPRTVWHQGGAPTTTKRLDSIPSWERSLKIEPNFVRGGILGRRLTRDGGRSVAGAPVVPTQTFGQPSPTVSHGSAVMHLAASSRLWVAKRDAQGQWLGCMPTLRPIPPAKHFDSVHFVQLPIPTIVDTTGTSLASYVLDAVHDAIEQAKPGQDVVANLSFGTHTGGHDGTSMLDCALLELLDHYDSQKDPLRPTLHLVLPAGNSHLWKCHASWALSPSQPSRELLWHVLPDDPTDNFLEIWLPDVKCEVVVLTPHGKSFPLQLPPGDPKEPAYQEIRSGADGKGAIMGAIISPAKPAQGGQGRMVLLALLGTGTIETLTPLLPQGTSLGFRSLLRNAELFADAENVINTKRALNSLDSSAPPGVYRIRVSASQPPGTFEAFRFHAWIQRGDATPLRGQSTRGFRGRQSYFLDTRDGAVDPGFTLNGIASLTHPRVFVAGSMRHSDNGISAYSAAGPSRDDPARCEGPDWVVHADESRNLPGLITSSFLGGAAVRVSGTSMAAAVLTRHLCEHLATGAKADTFKFLPHSNDEPGELVPPEAPERAHPVFRGTWRRFVPSRSDGAP